MYKDLQNLMRRYECLHDIITDILIDYRHYKRNVKNGANIAAQLTKQWTYEDTKKLTGAYWALKECKALTYDEARALLDFEEAMLTRLGYWT